MDGNNKNKQKYKVKNLIASLKIEINMPETFDFCTKYFPLYKFQKLMLIFGFVLIICCKKEPTAPFEETIPYQGIHINSNQIVNGYTDKISYSTTEPIKVFINSKDTIKNAVVKLYSVNGILVDSLMANINPQKIKNKNPWEYGYGYESTFIYNLRNLESGVYLWENKIPIIQKAKEPKEITVLYPSNTENAYCVSGGMSMYTTPVPSRVVSFQRPILFTFFAAKFLQWINQTEFRSKINYIADSDLEDYSILSKTKLLIITGHSEYWTRQARLNFDRFVDEGNDALILSGNTMCWQVRYNEENTQLLCYRESILDPILDPDLKTIMWYDPNLNYLTLNSIGADFDHGGYGRNDDTGWDGYRICTNSSPILEGLNIKKGDIINLPTHEYDGTPIKNFDIDGFPVIDNSKLKFYRSEIIGFDFGFRFRKTCGTFFIFKKTPTSGIIINTGTTDWGSERGIGGTDGEKIKIISRNMINKLLNKQNVFSQ